MECTCVNVDRVIRDIGDLVIIRGMVGMVSYIIRRVLFVLRFFNNLAKGFIYIGHLSRRD
jgi:hypothetical protein